MRSILNDIKTYLLTKYDYFTKGFANVSKPNQSNMIIDEDNQQYAGISDTEGNYFYIRSDKKATFTPIRRGVRIAYYSSKTTCRIVAVHHNGNADDIATSLMEGLSAKGHVVTSIDTDSTRVFRNETNTNLTDPSLTIVAVDFEVTQIKSARNCELNPCENC